MMAYSIGVDIGTSSTKAVAFSTHGQLLAKEAIHYPLLYPQRGWVELDPAVLLQSVVQCLSTLITQLNEKPQYIAFGAAMHGLMAINANGQPLTHCITWADTRATKQANALRQRKGQQLYEQTGVPIHPMSPLCKINWLREQAPSIFNATAMFADIKAWLFYQFTGEWQTDVSMAAATGLLNIGAAHWDAMALQAAGITTRQLPRVVDTQQVYYLQSSQASLQMLHNIPLVIGASDGALAHWGAGIAGPEIVSMTIGTSAALRVMVAAPSTDAQMRTFCYHAGEAQYIIGGASNNGAVLLDWLRNQLFQTNDTLDALLTAAFEVAPGAEGLTVLPYLLGERAPLWDAEAKAVFYGMMPHHTRAHLTRAVLESICYNCFTIGSVLMEAYAIKAIYASGGFAQQAYWLQMLADMFHLPVHASANTDTVALGAVQLGAKALQQTPPALPVSMANKVYHPNAIMHQHYQQGYQTFCRLNNSMANMRTAYSG